MKQGLLILILLAICALLFSLFVITAADFTPQGNIDLRNVYNIENASKAIAADNLKEKVSIKRVTEQLVSVYDSIIRE